MAKAICLREEKESLLSDSAWGALLQVINPIYTKKTNPATNSSVLIQNIPNTIAETPNTAREIKRVSQMDAVKITGKTRTQLVCRAPWLKTNTFWTPSGSMRPRASIKP